MNRKALIALAAGSAAAAVPALTALAPAAATAAGTPTLTIVKPASCYVNSYTYSTKTFNYTEHYAKVTVEGSGWTPGDKVVLNFGTQPTVTVGSDGTFKTALATPDPSLGTAKTVRETRATITATDQGAPDGSTPGGATATTKSFLYTSRAVYLWDPDGDYDGEVSDLTPNSPITFNAAGFTTGKPLYAHYVFTGYAGKSKPKLWRTISLGKLTGPCGTLHKAAHIAPANPPTSLEGHYTIQFDSSKSYSSRTSVQGLYHMNLTY